MLLDRQVVLLNPRLTVIFSCGFALLLFAIYHITVYNDNIPVQNIGAGGNQSVYSINEACVRFGDVMLMPSQSRDVQRVPETPEGVSRRDNTTTIQLNKASRLQIGFYGSYRQGLYP